MQQLQQRLALDRVDIGKQRLQPGPVPAQPRTQPPARAMELVKATETALQLLLLRQRQLLVFPPGRLDTLPLGRGQLLVLLLPGL